MIGRLCTVLAVLPLLAGCVAQTSDPVLRPPELSARRIIYQCADGQKIVATYISDDAVDFVRLDWAQQSYGLAHAISASGARYVGPIGPDRAGPGLVWWEAKGEATLSLPDDSGRADSRILLAGCKPQP